MEDVSTTADPRYLAIYLRDHHAGSAAGLGLVRRCRAANEGTAWEPMLAQLESEIAQDRRALGEMMRRLGVTPNVVKQAMGSLTQLAASLKANGHLTRYSPLSRLVELEALAAGIVTKRNLWRSLGEVADDHDGLRADELERLVEGATSQLERVLDGHRRAAVSALSDPVRETVTV